MAERLNLHPDGFSKQNSWYERKVDVKSLIALKKMFYSNIEFKFKFGGDFLGSVRLCVVMCIMLQVIAIFRSNKKR